MPSARVAAAVTVFASILAGCSIRPMTAGDASYALRGDRMAGDLASAEFAEAVWARLAAGRGAIRRADSGLPAETFSALDGDGDGRVTHAEWTRPVDESRAGSYRAAYRPFAAATFDLAGQGRAAIAYSDLDGALGRHPNRPDGLDVRTFNTAAGGAAMGLEKFESYYPSLSGKGIGAKGLGNFLLGPYLKFAGYVGSEFLMHRPRKPIKTQPSKLGYIFDEATLQSEDGTAIRAWYIPAAAASRKAVVLVHGHGSNRATWVESPNELQALHEAGYNVIALDLRRHGESGGEWITMSLREDNDVRAGVRWAEARGNTAIGLLGNSLGAASVIHAAATTPAIQAVWDDCAFASVRMAVDSAATMLKLPYRELVVNAILETSRRRLGEELTGDPQRFLPQFNGRPVYIVHGAADPYINAQSSHVNYAAARNPKSLWLVPGAGHGNSSSTQPAEYTRRMVGFFDQAIGREALPAFKI